MNTNQHTEQKIVEAATVILTREQAGRFQVYLLKRSSKIPELKGPANRIPPKVLGSDNISPAGAFGQRGCHCPTLGPALPGKRNQHCPRRAADLDRTRGETLFKNLV
jgi:hypothetical protein